MEMHTLNETRAKASVIRDSRTALKQMTSEQLLDLGMNQVVYLKSGMCDGEMLFLLIGADGMPGLSRFEDQNLITKERCGSNSARPAASQIYRYAFSRWSASRASREWSLASAQRGSAIQPCR